MDEALQFEKSSSDNISWFGKSHIAKRIINSPPSMPSPSSSLLLRSAERGGTCVFCWQMGIQLFDLTLKCWLHRETQRGWPSAGSTGLWTHGSPSAGGMALRYVCEYTCIHYVLGTSIRYSPFHVGTKSFKVTFYKCVNFRGCPHQKVFETAFV